MRQRDRSAIALVVVVIVLFVLYGAIDQYISNPETWHSTKYQNDDGTFVTWRPPKNEGVSMFNSVFQGGSGTPATLAMFGGQRYMIANIMWTYSDILFHKGKVYEMARALEATVTLNPSFMQAWSVYGWHLAWNLNAEATNKIEAEKFLQQGIEVYKRGILANPQKPEPYFDLAWLYLQRIGDYQSAMKILEHLVYGKNSKGQLLFQPLHPDDKKPGIDFYPLEQDRKWDPFTIGHRLAYCYKKHGVLTNDWTYIQKAADMYRRCYEIDRKDAIAKQNADEMTKNLHNTIWMQNQYNEEMKIRDNFQRGDYSPMAALGTEHEHEHGGGTAPN